MTYGLISFIMMEKNPREEGRDRVSDVWVTSELEHDRDSGSEMDIVDVESEQAGSRIGINNSNTHKKRQKRICLIIIIVVIVLLIICGILIWHHKSNSTVDCSDDSFEGIPVAEYRGGKKQSDYIKVKFAKDDDDDHPFTKEKAEAKCLELGAHLWKVKHRNEFLKVLSLPDAQNKAFWLNHDEDTVGGDGCTYVPLKSGDRISERTTCQGDFWAVCVKRNCINPKGEMPIYTPRGEFSIH